MSDTPNGPYTVDYHQSLGYLFYDAKRNISPDEVCNRLNSQHAEIKRLRETLTFALGIIDDLMSGNSVTNASLEKIRTALENRQ